MEIGDVVGGRYRIEGRLVGEVWCARDVVAGRAVVVKVLGGVPGAGVWLRHVGIVGALEVGECEGRPVLVREWVDGYTFEDHLLDGWYRADQVAEFGAQVAEALVVAHRAGVTHGGIGLERLVLTSDGVVKILGFGTVAPPLRSDLVALGETMHELLGGPAAPDGAGELGVLIAELGEESGAQDPQRTEGVAVRLRRLAGESARRPAVPGRFWIDKGEERRPLGRVLVAVILAGMVAVTAYAIVAVV
ncbi:hypothetical protein AB0K51_04610 [Kitasatospora sp. NPDC049285]|uniref:hypothetical protein n=1 Tax=Kitasatospora sp. NPDC049285 TaxID=3157096 RepID=UPI0034468D62